MCRMCPLPYGPFCKLPIRTSTALCSGIHVALCVSGIQKVLVLPVLMFYPVYIHCILHNAAYGLTMYRGTEVVESTVRQHIGACFSALEQRVLSTLHEASQRLSSSPAASPAPSQDTSTQDKPLLQASRLFLLSCLQQLCFEYSLNSETNIQLNTWCKACPSGWRIAHVMV